MYRYTKQYLNVSTCKRDTYLNRAVLWLLLVLATFVDPSWWDDAESKYVRFSSGVPIEVTFKTEEPEKKMLTTKDGKQIPSYQWRVTIKDGGRIKEKILAVASRRLLQALMAENKKAPLLNRSLIVTAIGEGVQRIWTISEAK